MSERPVIDYTDKDYTALRRAMLDLARQRVPEWTDRTPSDLGVLLTDMVAMTGDVVLYYLDRVASEMFPDTAVERRSIVQLLRLIGYELRAPVPAAATLTLTFDIPPPATPSVITIPVGARFHSSVPSDDPQSFEYLGPALSVDLRSDQVRPAGTAGQAVYDLPVWHGVTGPATVIGSSRGEANQSYRLPMADVLLDSLVLEVDEGAGWVTWTRRESFLYDVDDTGRARVAAADGRDYLARYDADGTLVVHFGDGRFGSIPPRGSNNIRVTVRTGGGVKGNVPAGAIDKADTTIAQLSAVTNARAAAGGEDAEASETAARNAPMVHRSGRRAVTADDYAALALAIGGVAKVRARARSWNLIELTVAPTGETCGPAPEALRLKILDYFEDKRMAGVRIQVLDPSCIPVDLIVHVRHDPRFDAARVRQSVATAIAGHFDYDSVDFGEVFHLSDLYALIEATPGVLSTVIRRFRRRDRAPGDVDAALREAGLPPATALPESLRALLAEREAVATRIEMGASEIATLGTLDLTLSVGTP